MTSHATSPVCRTGAPAATLACDLQFASSTLAVIAEPAIKTRHVVLSLVLVTLASACGPIEFATKKVVQVRTEPGAPLCQQHHLVYDLAAEPSFTDLKANLGGLKVVNVTATVTDVLASNRATHAHGALSLQADTGAALSLASYDGLAVAKAATTRLTLDQPTAQKLGQVLLTAPHRVTVDALGCSDEVPAQFDLQLEFTLGADLKLF